MNKIHYWSDKNIINKVKNSLCNNNIIITSTDTVLGLLGNITQKSFEKITKIKGPRKEKPFLIIINSMKKLSKFVDPKSLNNKNLKLLLKKHWPGPLTIIFKCKKELPTFLKSKKNTIAIRLPKHVGLQKILKHFDALFSTSANKTNEPTPQKHQELSPEVIQPVEYILIEKEKLFNSIIDTKKNLEQTFSSTIIDVSSIDTQNSYSPLVIREGVYSIKELEETYGAKFKK